MFMRFSTWRSRSVSLCGLPLRGWAVVAPRHFHFTITALTVDRGSSSRAEIWQTDLLERWHPMTVPSWKSLSSSVRTFYCQCLSMEIELLCARFYTPVSNGCGWNSWINSFEGVSTYFCIYSVYYVLGMPPTSNLMVLIVRCCDKVCVQKVTPENSIIFRIVLS